MLVTTLRDIVDAPFLDYLLSVVAEAANELPCCRLFTLYHIPLYAVTKKRNEIKISE
jgi:hypothetical protein